ncbi:hypothetical protein ARSEF1564_007264 [Beauveria bassiana]
MACSYDKAPHSGSLLELYDVATIRDFPKKYTFFDQTSNFYTEYTIPRKITMQDLRAALDQYSQRAAGDEAKFAHEYLKVRRWKASSQVEFAFW